MAAEDIDKREAAISRFYRDRQLAHRILFAHRHKNATPLFHERMIDQWYNATTPAYMALAFRGGAKSSIAEEALSLQTCLKEFRYPLILGASSDRACERLHAVKKELLTNEMLIELFGEQRGETWADDVITTISGQMIRALGRGQSILGIKFEDQRPDFLLIDDIEDRESVRTPQGRDAAYRWLMFDVIPALDPKAKIRMAATPRDPDDIPHRIMRESGNENAEWSFDLFPIEYPDDAGARVPAWPDRFPLSWIDKKRTSALRSGTIRDFNMEFMVDAKAMGAKDFTHDMFRVEPRPRTWQPVYTMHDPARTVKSTSATTGYAAWSWIGPKLVVWDASAQMLMPNEIIDSLFSVNEQFHPVMLGIEEDGLNEWLMQPIRTEQVRRGVMLPVQAVRAPKGKIDFIRGLQQYFNAREVEFAKELPELRAQFLGFPTGKIDGPNALAYALKLRPGAPFYDDFTVQNISEFLQPRESRPTWLCLNATPSVTTGVLVQFIDGCLSILADWVREGEPTEQLKNITQEAGIEGGRIPKLVCGPHHFEKFSNVGLTQAVKKLPMEVRKGARPEMGRPDIRAMLRRQVRGSPALMISSNARWTLNAFSAGYCRAIMKDGLPADYAAEGVYRVLMEGLEAFGGLLKTGSPDEDESGINYDISRDGRQFISARVKR